MFQQSVNPTTVNPLLNELLGALTVRPAAALLTTPTVHLFSAINGSIGPNLVVAQLTECNFGGYVNVSNISLSADVNLPSGLGRGVVGSAMFIANSAINSPGQSAIGYWVDDGAGNISIAEKFAEAQNFVLPGDFLELSVVFGQISIVTVE